MVFNDAINLNLGNAHIQKVYVGDKMVWPRADRKYLSLDPCVLWISDESDIQFVEVVSNTNWNVE